MTSGTLRLAFAGTPAFACAVLESILETGRHKVQKVLTQPDRPGGRGQKLRPSEVKTLALAHRLSVFQPATATELEPTILTDCDIMLVVAYSLLLPEVILSTPRLGCINLHTSLLPRWRGAAPIQRTIEAGDIESGITYIKMEKGLDSGPIIAQFHCPVTETDTAGDLHGRLAQLASDSVNNVLDKINSGEITNLPQDDAVATYAGKISKQKEAALDWTKSAIGLQRKIRAFNPTPGAHTTLNGIKMRIWEADVKENTYQRKIGEVLKSPSSLDVVTAQGILSITRLQIPGKRIITARDFLNSHPDFR